MQRKEPVSDWQAFWLVFLSVVATTCVIILAGAELPAAKRMWSQEAAGWAAVVVTAGSAIGAVFGAFKLWEAQQREKAERTLQLGIMFFVRIHRLLLEIKALTDYDTWLEYNRQIAGGHTRAYTHAEHQTRVTMFLEALIVDSEYAIANTSALIDNLADVDPDKIEALLRMAHLVAGFPTRLKHIRKEWKRASIAHGPAELTEENFGIVVYAISATAYYLRILGHEQRSDSELYEQVHRVQQKIWDGSLSRGK